MKKKEQWAIIAIKKKWLLLKAASNFFYLSRIIAFEIKSL